MVPSFVIFLTFICTIIAINRNARFRPHIRYADHQSDPQNNTPEKVGQQFPPYWWPPEVYKVYNFPEQHYRPNIGIIEMCDPDPTITCGFLESDINYYWDVLNKDVWPCLGVPETKNRPTITSVFVYDQMNNLTGVNNPGYANGDMEVVADIEVSTGLFPGFDVDVTVYFAPNTNQGGYNAFKYAIDSGLHVAISSSWGEPEYYAAPSPFNNYVLVNGTLVSYFSAMQTLLKDAAEKGITCFIASGDSGASDSLPTPYNTDNPASFPYTIGVGATSLSLKNPKELEYNNNAIEVVWNELLNGSQAASGGGYSQFFLPPSYQFPAIEKTINGPQSYKGVPDVSATGGVSHGYTIYISLPDGQGVQPPKYMSVGGTSLAAPLWASLWAIITDGNFVHAGEFLYSLDTVAGFHDITGGNNIFTTADFGSNGFSATPGYDLCSGLGSPNGANLQDALLFGQTEKNK